MTDTIRRLSRDQRSDVQPRIVHLGLGVFSRAHLADYIRRLNKLRPNDPWLICGVSLRNPDVRNALKPQGSVYTIIERNGPRNNPDDAFVLCDSVCEVLFSGDDVLAIQERLGAPETQIISITVTEKGYCRSTDGTLDIDNEEIAADISTLRQNPEMVVKTLPGWVSQAIISRCKNDLPITIISLDNLPDNGESLRKIISGMLRLVNEPTARWMDEGNVTFPSSVVDRIVPSTSDGDRQDVVARLKLEDAWPVATEPYTDWVLQDLFCTPQPNWAGVGVTVSADVGPFEETKLRLLNGPHSFIAYLGQLTDRETVADVVANKDNEEAVKRYMEEAQQTVSTPENFDAAAYQDSILERFRNVALRHRTAQIAMDGSEKIPQRWLAVIEGLRQNGRPVRLLAGALALWMRYLEGKSESGNTLEISDPRSIQLIGIVSEMSGPEEALTDMLSLLQSGLAEDETLINDVAMYYHRIIDAGAAGLIRALTN